MVKKCYTKLNMNKNKAIIVSVVIVALTIATAFYILNSEKTTSNTYKQAPIASEKQPSKILKEYIDDSGFSFKYPDDVQVGKIEINDSITYSNLELTSSQAKGRILIKVADTQLKSIDEWFSEEGLKRNIEEIKIGEISGSQLQMDDKIIAAAINQNILFTIEVDTQGYKYWQSVYNTILSSFSFVSQKENVQTQEQSLDDSGDAILEEEIIE